MFSVGVWLRFANMLCERLKNLRHFGKARLLQPSFMPGRFYELLINCKEASVFGEGVCRGCCPKGDTRPTRLPICLVP
jgi:hypothetical protein